jgi:hypothetical protein
MKIVTAFISDRGDKYLPECLETYWQRVGDQSETVYTVDDREHMLGMAGAVREAWSIALDLRADYLFHVEEDWRFESRVDLAGLVRVLEKRPHLAQVILKRGAEMRNAEEAEAGGFMEAHPEAYEELMLTSGERWCEHEQFFSLNPCLIPRRTLELGWHDDNEAGATAKFLAAGLKFAVWGGLYDAPVIKHLGIERGNGWRL